MPQVLPVLHAAALEAALKPLLLLPVILEANFEIFLFTFGLPQAGQLTPSISLALRTSSSKGWPHWVHTNSNKGIASSRKIDTFR